MILTNHSLFGQSNFTKDYNIIDSLTKNLSSYNIFIRVNGNKLSEVPMSLANEITRTYPFLKSKKRVYYNPAFILIAVVGTTFIEEPKSLYLREDRAPFSFRSASEDGKEYKLVFRYFLTASLQITRENKFTYQIDLGKKDFESTPTVKIYDTDYFPGGRFQNNNIDLQLKYHTANFPNQVQLLMSGFYAMLKEYKKK